MLLSFDEMEKLLIKKLKDVIKTAYTLVVLDDCDTIIVRVYMLPSDKHKHMIESIRKLEEEIDGGWLLSPILYTPEETYEYYPSEYFASISQPVK